MMKIICRAPALQNATTSSAAIDLLDPGMAHRQSTNQVSSYCERGDISPGMAETWGDVIKKLKAVAHERGKPISDGTAQQVLEREYCDLFAGVFDPLKPSPEISAEEYDNMADLATLDQT
jgi:hypothetical protein